MSIKYLLPMAKNVDTGQTVKIQDLTGFKYAQNQRSYCQEKANELASNLTERTGDSWVGFVKEYLPTYRR